MKPLFKWPFNTGFVPVLSVFLLLVIVSAILAALSVSKFNLDNKEYLLRAGEVQVLGHQIASYTQDAVTGSEPAFTQLLNAKNRASRLIDELKNGHEASELPVSPASMQSQLRKVDNAWLELRAHADAILAGQEQVLAIGDTLEVLNEIVSDLQERSEELAKTLFSDKRASQQQVYFSTRQLMLSQRISTSRQQVLLGGTATAEAIDQLANDVTEYSKIVDALLDGSNKLKIKKVVSGKAQKQLKALSILLIVVNDNVFEILENIPEILPALAVLADSTDTQLAAKALLDGSLESEMEVTSELSSSTDYLSSELDILISQYRSLPGNVVWGWLLINPLIVTILGVLAVFLLIGLGILMIQQSREREQASDTQYKKNQDAIRRLLDEMGDLADGDLTVEATVTEDITGTIADSVNFAIESMRDLVVAINKTSVKVSASAQENRSTAMHLADASVHQREQIEKASSRIKLMSQTMGAMASDAKKSIKVAEYSLGVATKGGDNVRNTISGMDKIKDQIQETSKRIKRLGESSQEIGDIVELIDDISDQTNILALNAAMQAAMAGDAGRGFAVVADEVQRLAERTSNATKQIEALVKTIQSDTNEAVASMESSTTEVIGGAKLAEQAGESLHEIEDVSERMTKIITTIAGSAYRQSEEANNLTDIMNVIQEITNQTTEGTNNTATSIGILSDEINELRSSVAGFRLPEES